MGKKTSQGEWWFLLLVAFAAIVYLMYRAEADRG